MEDLEIYSPQHLTTPALALYLFSVKFSFHTHSFYNISFFSYTEVYVYCFPSEQRTLPPAPQRSLRLEGENPFGFWPTPASIHPYLNSPSPFSSYPISSSRRIPLPQLLIPLVMGWMVAPKKICPHPKSSNYGCCLIWKRVFKMWLP